MIRIILGAALRLSAQAALRKHRAIRAARSHERTRADRQAARRDQFRQRRAGAEGRRRRAAGRLAPICRASSPSASACRSSSSPSRRPARRSRPPKDERGRCAVHRDRAGARRRRRVLAALRADRRHLHGAEGFAAARQSPTSTSAGVRIAVGRGSAYDLYLTRTLKNATLVRAATGGCCAMIDLFRAEKLEAVAGVRQPLVEYAKAAPRRARDGRPLPGDPPGDGHAEGPARRRRLSAQRSSRR